MFEKLISKVETWANKRHAMTALALVSFADSSFFPISPYFLAFAMLIHEKKPSWIKVATIGSVFSLLGGIFGYIIGKFFYEYIGAPLVALYGFTAQMNAFGSAFGQHIFWAILLASLTPAPYKIFTISAGVFSAPFIPFLLASLIGRSVRFYTVAYITHKYGVHARRLMIEQKRALYITIAVIFLLIILYGVLAYYGIL